MLDSIKGDNSVPKNVRFRVDDTIRLLEGDCEICLKINKALNELEEISNDPNIPNYTRVEVLNIVSILSNDK